MDTCAEWPQACDVFIPGRQFYRIRLDESNVRDVRLRTMPLVVTVSEIKIPDADIFGDDAPVLIEFIVKKGSAYYRQGDYFILTPMQAGQYYQPLP